MVDVTILGSSSGIPSADRRCSSLIFQIKGNLYQFDAGEGTYQTILNSGIDHSRISVIIISHGHSDHITGLFMELQMMHLAQRTEPLAIYMPSELIDSFEKFLEAVYLFPEQLGFQLDVRPVIPDPVFRDDNLAVYARANSHFEKYRKIITDARHPNQMQSYSYVIKTDNTRILYSGDIGSLDDYADLLDGCRLLITEGAHLDLERLFEAVAANRVEYLLLTHLTAEMYAQPQPIMDLAAKYGISNLHIAYDGFKLGI